MIYDCMHLRNDAEFETKIGKNIFWVPVNTLGKTRYTNDEIYQMITLSPCEKKNNIGNLYESIQLFLISKFHYQDNDTKKFINNHCWEYFKDGISSLQDNQGSCAASSEWLKYLLKDKYECVGYIGYIKNTGEKHFFNYIFHQGSYYIYDLYPLNVEYLEFALLETGKLQDFIGAKYTTGALIKCNSLIEYADYFRRFQLLRGIDYYFFYEDGNRLSPCSIKTTNEKVYVYFQNPQDIHLLSPNNPKFDFPNF